MQKFFAELRKNLRKYLDMVTREKVVVRFNKSKTIEIVPVKNITVKDEDSDNTRLLEVLKRGEEDIAAGRFTEIKDPKKYMGKYMVILTPEAKDELRIWEKTGDKFILRKIEKVLFELSEHQTTGTGKAGRLRGDFSGYWSRRVNKKDRIIYKIIDSVVTVQFHSHRGHYRDS